MSLDHMLPYLLLGTGAGDTNSSRGQTPGGRWLVAVGGWHVAGGWFGEAGGGRLVALADIVRSVDIRVLIIFFAQSPRQHCTLAYGYSVGNSSLGLCRIDIQLDLGESRFPTQIVQRNLGLWSSAGHATCI